LPFDFVKHGNNNKLGKSHDECESVKGRGDEKRSIGQVSLDSVKHSSKDGDEGSDTTNDDNKGNETLDKDNDNTDKDKEERTCMLGAHMMRQKIKNPSKHRSL
jgi:hypothetical protein